MLADKDNAHTMDPERYRADVTKMRLHGADGPDGPGLYTKISFADDQAARAVLANKRLGVSMRLRESVATADGRTAPVVPIHVLGTLDPKITNLGEWHEAVELSSYAAGDEVVDLSTERYRESGMAKGKGKTKTSAADTKDIDFAALTAEDIENGVLEGVDFGELTDEELQAIVGKFDADELEALGAAAETETEDESGDESDEDGETELSAAAQHQIDLANAQAERAMAAAQATEKRLTEQAWKSRRRELLAKGIPPEKIDLCEPYLARPDALDQKLNEHFEASFPDLVPAGRRGATD
jgi:hypothetical protein